MANILTQKDIRIFYSSASATNADGTTSNYLGGARTTQELSDNRLHNIFPKTTKDEETSGITKFRCLYLYNNSPDTYLKNPVMFIVSDTTSSNDFVAIGWGNASIGTGLTGATDNSIEPVINDQYTFPTNVTFFTGNNRNTGAVLDEDIPPKMGKPFWLMYKSNFGAQDTAFNMFQFRVQSDNLKGLSNNVNVVTVPKIKINVVGECSSTSDFTTMANYAMASSPDFICTTGDNNISGTSSVFTSAFSSYLNRMLLAFGPSDVANLTTRNNYIASISSSKFAPNIVNGYYSKTFGNVHFLVMDTSFYLAYDADSPQFTFVQNDLQKAYADATIDWIMVLTNACMYSSPSTTSGSLPQTDLRNLYHDMFVQYGVCVVFQGTFHAYERTQVLGYNVTDPNTPTTFQYDGPFQYTIKDRKSFDDGCIFVTVGTGGAALDTFSAQFGGSWYLDSFEFGYGNIIVDNTTRNKSITFRFYSTSRGTQFFVDEFQITRVPNQ